MELTILLLETIWFKDMAVDKILIIMATYNGEDWIKHQLESIKRQSYIFFDIFVFDDCSSDSTLNIIQSSFKDVKIFKRDKNLGSASKNFFSALLNIDLSHYKYISFSDQDDIWMSHKIERAVNYLSNYNYDAYSSNVLAFWNGNLSKTKLNDKSYSQVKYDHFFESAGPGCTYLISNRLADDIKNYIKNNGFDSVNHHDWFCYAYARSRSYKWFIDSTPSVFYRQHDKNVIGDNVGIFAYINRLKIIYSGDYRINVNNNLTFLKVDSNLFNNLNNRFFLIKNFYKLRRNLRDKLALLFLIILGIY